MGGNTIVNNIKPNKIDLLDYGIDDLIMDVQEFLYNLNYIFNKKYNEPLFNNELIIENKIYNGSSSIILNPSYRFEILRYRKYMGDLDVVIDKTKGEKLLEILKYSYKIGRFEQLGLLNRNKIGQTIISIFKFKNYNLQVDFEMVEYQKNGYPTEFALFSRSSSFKDIKKGIKGVFSKFLLRSIAGTKDVITDFVLLTPKTNKPVKKQPKELRPYKFSVQKGLTDNAYINIEKNFYKENKNRNYYTDLRKISEILFGDSIYKENLYSFIDLINLCNKTFDKERNIRIYNRFKDIIFEEYQQIEKDKAKDLKIKNKALKYLENNLKIS